jgi:hypothetical protein
MDKHSQVFFGQATGIIVNSPSKSLPNIFIRAIKKKPDDSWEKPSNGEGKSVSLRLEEIIQIYYVLSKKLLTWKTVHEYKENKTSISINWDKDDTKIWLNIGDYSKMLNLANAELLKLLLKHILKEKIEFATGGTKQDSNTSTTPTANNSTTPAQNLPMNETKASQSDDVAVINATMMGETEKALLLTFKSGQELWIPKSTIHNDFNFIKESAMDFLIDKWILKKNSIIAS